MVISRCCFAEDGTDLFISACGTCCPLIFPHSTNQILNLWRCRCLSRLRCLSSLIVPASLRSGFRPFSLYCLLKAHNFEDHLHRKKNNLAVKKNRILHGWKHIASHVYKLSRYILKINTYTLFVYLQFCLHGCGLDQLSMNIHVTSL